MQVNQIPRLLNQIHGRQNLRKVKGWGVKAESSRAKGCTVGWKLRVHLFGVQAKTLGTYTGVIRSDIFIQATGRAVAVSSDGEMATWAGLNEMTTLF